MPKPSSGSPDDAPRDARIALVALPGCFGSAVAGSVEAFSIANSVRASESASLRIAVVRATDEPVVGFAGLEVPSRPSIEEIEGADVVILPPLFGLPDALIAEHRPLVDRLAARDAPPRVLAAACTATFLIAETGRLDGRHATTNPSFRRLFEARFPRVRLRTALRVVDDGDIVTAGATSSYLDLALALVGRFLGPRVALETARLLSTDPNPRSQQPYLLPRGPAQHTDEEVRRAEEWISAHLGEPCDTASLARVAGLGQRTFLRRFRAATGETPREFLQRRRVEAAMKDLEATNLAIDEITRQCGYEDARSFRRLFHRHTGVSPAEYRRRFGYARAQTGRLQEPL